VKAKDEVVRANMQFRRDKGSIEAAAAKKRAHLKYFHDHIMKTLKLNSSKFGAQLESKLKEIEAEKSEQLQQADRQRKAEANLIEREKQRKVDHLR